MIYLRAVKMPEDQLNKNSLTKNETRKRSYYMYFKIINMCIQRLLKRIKKNINLNNTQILKG